MRDDTRRVIEERARLDLQDRVEALSRVELRIRETMSSRGLLASGFTIAQIRDAVRSEARVRAYLVWHAVARGLTAAHTPLTAALADEAKSLVRTLLSEHSGDLEGHLQRAHELTSIGTPDRASDLIAPALERVNNEIDYALLSAPGETESRSADNVVNVYQGHGIVQTGAHSIANLSVVFGEDEKRQVAEALDLARQSLDSHPDRDSPERGQTLVLVEEAEAEIKEAQPNHVKLRSMLSGIAGTVQTIGASREALEALKAAGALLGLSLP